MSGHLCLKWNNHSTAFLKSISNIQIKERYCDATIVCQGKYFPVHRVVLSTCSDYFDEMFERMQCQHPYIVFKDIDPKEMEMLLNYMYQGEVNVAQESLPTLIKSAEALRIKGLAVPDDLPSKESSGRKRSSASHDMPVPKKRSEERRRRRDSSDQTSHPSTSSNNRENLDDSIEAIESKFIKEEPLDTGYNDPPHSTDYREAAYSQSDPSSVDPNQTKSSNKKEGHFVDVTFPSSEETDSYVKQEPTAAVPNESFNDEQSSSWSDFASGDIMDDLPPETSNQEDISKENGNVEDAFWSLDAQQISSYTSCDSNSLDPIWLKSARGFTCPYCGYKSSSANNIKIHIRFKHTGERPFQCPVCPKRFPSNSNLQVHMRIHTGERPFKCSICFLKFTQKIALTKHMKSVHKENVLG